MSLTSATLAHALDLGFDGAAVLPLGSPRYAAQFLSWLDAGYHGEMAYLAARTSERIEPALLAPAAASMIVLRVSYNSEECTTAAEQPSGRIARYARQTDYHETLKPKLYALDAFIRERTGRQTLSKVFADSAPVLERDFAEQAGLGFIGRNTCLITPGVGSWTFLAGLLAPETMEEGRLDRKGLVKGDREKDAGCGRCTRCLDACPTHAFVAPHVLDARRCISYLTIELRGAIPHDLRPLIGDWVFGCDVCQEVCPYNRHAKSSQAGDQRSARIPLADLLALDEVAFRARFRGTPVTRAKRRGLVRNACVAAGNSGDAALAPVLTGLLADPDPLVRSHAAWALQRIGSSEGERGLAHACDAEAK